MARHDPSDDARRRPSMMAWAAGCLVSLAPVAACATGAGALRHETRKAQAVLTPLGDGLGGGGSVALVEQAIRGGGLIPRHALALRLSVTGLAPGRHGVALLDARRCDNLGAAPHFNPDGGIHGGLHDVAGHAGDLGNIDVDADGRGEYVIEPVTAFDLGDAVGRVIVIGSDADDAATQPDGGAGAPVLCGVIGAD